MNGSRRGTAERSFGAVRKSTPAKSSDCLFDHLVGSGKERWLHGDAERPRGLQICLGSGQENRQAWRLSDAIGEKAVGIDCRQTVTGGKGDDGVAMHNIEIFRQNQQSPALFAREPRRHRLDLGIVATRRGCHLKHSGFECLTGCNVSGSRSILVSASACAPIAGGGQRRCRCSPCQSQGSSFISDSAGGWLKPSKKRAARRGDAGACRLRR